MTDSAPDTHGPGVSPDPPVTAATVSVPLLTLDALYRAATDDGAHAYYEGYNGRRIHSRACTACDAIDKVRKVLNANR